MKIQKLQHRIKSEHIKIDVKGYETAFLQDGERTLPEDSLTTLLVELNSSEKRNGFDEQKIHNN